MESYLSNVGHVMPRTKKEAEELAPQLVAELTNDPQNIINFLAMHKHFTTLMDLVKKDGRLITTTKNNELEMEALGCKVSVQKKTTYDYSDDPELDDINSQIKKLQDKKKSREKLLKTVLESPDAGIVDKDTGELAGKAEVKSISTFFKVDYKE